MANTLTQLLTLIDAFSAIQDKNAVSPASLGSLLRQIASVCSQYGGGSSSGTDLSDIFEEIDLLSQSVNSNANNISANTENISTHSSQISNLSDAVSALSSFLDFSVVTDIDNLKLPTTLKLYKVTNRGYTVAWMLVYRSSADTNFYGQVMMTPLSMNNGVLISSMNYGEFHIYHRCYNARSTTLTIATGEEVEAKQWSKWREIAGDGVLEQLAALKADFQQYRYEHTPAFFKAVLTSEDISVQQAGVEVSGEPSVFWLEALKCFAVKVNDLYYNTWTVEPEYEAYDRRYYREDAANTLYLTKLYVCNNLVSASRKIYFGSIFGLAEI